MLFVLGLVFVPMMDGVLNPQSQLALVIVLLFAFNMIGGSPVVPGSRGSAA